MTGQTLSIILSQSAALLCLGAYLREYRKGRPLPKGWQITYRDERGRLRSKVRT